MKKYFWLTWLTLISILVFLPIAQANSIDGAKTQGFGKYSVGLVGEHIFEKDLKYDEGLNLASGEGVENVKIKHLYRVMAKYNFGFWENLDMYVKLGVANFKADYEVNNNLGNEIRNYTMDGKANFTFTVGAKGTYEFAKTWLLGADAQFGRYSTKDDTTIRNLTTGVETTTLQKPTILQWHVACYLAKEFKNLTPYVGARYSDLKMTVKSETVCYKMNAKNKVGVFVGLGYEIGDRWRLNLEGGFVDETAISLSGAYRF